MQNYVSTLAAGDNMRTTVLTTLPSNDESLRTLFSGPSAPPNPIAFQLWQDTGTNTLYQRDSTNTSWLPCRRREVRFGDVALAARTWRAVPCASVPIYVASIAIVGSATTAASAAGTKEWTWNLKNQATGLSLFSAIPSTATVVGGVGGGELTADSPKFLAANQNQSLSAGDELRFVVVQVGAPTAVADIAFVVSYWELLT